MPKRTPRGRGSIYRDASRDRWVVELHHEGQRYRAYARTEADAWRVRDELYARANLGMAPGRTPTLNYFILEEWLPSLTVRPHTLRAYRSKLTTHVLPILGTLHVDKLTPAHLRKLFKELEAGGKVKDAQHRSSTTATAGSAAAKRSLQAGVEPASGAFPTERTTIIRTGLSPRTVAHVRAILRNALRRAEQDGYVTRNVAALTDPPSVPNVERHALSLAEARTFLVSLRGDRMEALYTVAITLGLRQSELLGLRWVDVKLSSESVAITGIPGKQAGKMSGFLSIRQTLHRIGGQAVIDTPKTPRSRRDIPLSKGMVAVLNQHRLLQKEELLASGARPTHDLVFTTRSGHALAASTLIRNLYRRLDALGIERVTWHDMRHAAASMLLASGLGPREIMAVLGHASFNLSMTTYAHADAEELARKMEGVGF